jgi:AraC-like DNA-binding protein
VGYDYNYISKVFKKTTGLTFKEYLTDLRISEACQLLLHTEKSAREISEECGFGCQRSFNREFLTALGMTPVEYRKGQKPHQTAK